MSYQVLARKWRPKTFNELMGQQHVVNVLVNALTQQRLHHAYLFTGTRGVGKTTIARIFAKSLNCETGITATPCGKCDICQDIDNGRFIDLLEIDAASRTKVDDTREILDNVQYAPSRGRFKVYLIDEVHMLSRSSFNALLKTLEEPPEHVKFILATTDPQKLPVTVLSRCLQFHLKALTVKEIEDKLTQILNAEQVKHEAGSLTLLAKAARGSMRDSLSLTDQAIAQGQGNIALANIQSMLGSVDQHWPYKILICLIKQDSQGLMALSQQIASYAPSYSRLYAELIQLLHQVAMSQVVAGHFDLSPEHASLMTKFCQAMSPEDVQLYYQILLNGRKDLPYAGDEQAAFDMSLLRLLAFKPVQNAQQLPTAASQTAAVAENSFEEFDTLETQLAKAPEATPVVANSVVERSVVQNSVDESAVAENVLDESSEPNIDAQSQEAVESPQSIQSLEVEEQIKHNEPSLFAEDDIFASDELNHQMSDIEAIAAQQVSESPAAQQEHLNIAAPFSEPLPEPEISFEQSYEPEFEMINEAENEEQSVSSLTASEPESPLPDDSQLNQLVQPTVFEDASFADILETRNMLRSRKKQLEKVGKKSEDATTRQPSANISTPLDSVTEEQSPAPVAKSTANIIEVPDVSTLPEQPYTPEIIDPSVVKKANQIDKWANMVDAMALNGRLRQLAINATIDDSSNDEKLVLCLNQATKHLKSDAALQQLQTFVSQYFNRPMAVEIQVVEQTIADPYQIQTHINDKRYEYAKELLLNDDLVQQMQERFQATLDETTVIAR